MRRLPILMIQLLTLAALGCSPEPGPAEKIARDFYLGGIQVHEEDLSAWYDHLLARGMNTVHVTDYALQGEWDSDDLSWEGPPKRALAEIRGAKERGLSVILVLRVQLDASVDRNAFLWHGMIMPGSPERIDSWFEKYRRYCLEWAQIAEREGIEMVILGNELNALASTLEVSGATSLERYFLSDDAQDRRRADTLAQRDLLEGRELSREEKEQYGSVEQYLEARIATERGWARQLTQSGEAEDPAAALAKVNARRAALGEHWSRLIREARGVYSGRLGYAANFDQYADVGFWHELDVMAMSAYFSLRRSFLDGHEPLERLSPALEQHWDYHLGQIDAVRRQRGLGQMPVLFTEMGYLFRAGTTLEPWSHHGFSVIYTEDGDKRVVVWNEQPEEPRERALAVRALHAAHGRLENPLLLGILYWKLSSHAYHKDIEPYLVDVGPESEDPILEELRRFTTPPA